MKDVLKYIVFVDSKDFEEWQENNDVTVIHVSPLLPLSDIWVAYKQNLPVDYYD